MPQRAVSTTVATASNPVHLLGHRFEYNSPYVLESTLDESLNFQSLLRGQFVPQGLLETSIFS